MADRSYDPADASHRALRGIRRELERHPAVISAQGFPPDSHARVVARLDDDALGVEANDPTLTVRWFAGETPDARPQFSFHYSDDRGVDFGWHHEPNPHVEGWGHFQHRPASDAEYTYESHGFAAETATRLVWEIASLLIDRLDAD